MYGQIGGQTQAMSWLNDNFTLLPTKLLAPVGKLQEKGMFILRQRTI